VSEIFDELSRPTWWISVVVVGLIVNLASAYLKGPLDNSLASSSAWWRRRSEKRRAEWERFVAEIGSSTEARNEAFFSEIRSRQKSASFLLGATFLMVMATGGPLFIMPKLFSAVTFLASSLSFLLSIFSVENATYIHGAFGEAKKRANNSFKADGLQPRP